MKTKKESLRVTVTISKDDMPQWYQLLSGFANGFVRAEIIRAYLKSIHSPDASVLLVKGENQPGITPEAPPATGHQIHGGHSAGELQPSPGQHHDASVMPSAMVYPQNADPPSYYGPERGSPQNGDNVHRAPGLAESLIRSGASPKW